jgi:integrase
MSVLRDAALQPATVTKYRNAVQSFLSFCSSDDSTPSDHLLSLSATDIDLLMAAFIDEWYHEGRSFDTAKNAVYGAIFFQPLLKNQLLESQLRLEGWKRLHPSKPRAPLTWSLSCLLAASMARSGFLAPAIATLLAFDCYLRIGEFTSLTVADIAVPSDPRLGSAYTGMVVVLKAAKTGRNQSVPVRRSEVRQLLHAFVQGRPITESVFGLSAAQYSRVLAAACAAVGLSENHYSAHSLRHGGATEDYMAGVPLQDILFRGRWAQGKSATTYVQSGRALLLANSIPLHVHRLATAVTADVVSIVSSAPPPPPPSAIRASAQ